MRGARAAVLLGAAALTSVDLAVKAGVERALLDGTGAQLGPLDLRLGYNSGVAFSLGAGLPAWVVTVATGVVTVGLVAVAWRTVTGSDRWGRAAWAAILGGATGNLLDRAGDGAVTDYLHTGWFPTFNLADVLLTMGVLLLAVSALLRPADPTPDGAVPADDAPTETWKARNDYQHQADRGPVRRCTGPRGAGGPAARRGPRGVAARGGRADP